MRQPNQNSTMQIQSPLAFDLCLKALRSILRQENFEVVSEALVREKQCGDKGQKCQRLAVLVVWNASYAYQALAMDCNAGLLMPFCLSILEDESCSVVAASDYTGAAVDAASAQIRVLARILHTKMSQIFLELSAHGSVHDAVNQGGGIYRGIQYGSPERGMPDLVLFDDPVTKTTLALAFGGSPVCPEAVTTKIKNSRKVFQAAQAARDGTKPPDRSWDDAGTRISWAV